MLTSFIDSLPTSTQAKSAAESDPEPSRRRLCYAPQLPREFIRIDYHENSGLASRIISLDPDLPNQAASEDVSTSPSALDDLPSPWAPFASRADFEFAEAMTNAQASKKTVNAILDGLHGSWSCAGSNVSFRKYDDMEKALNAARVFVTDVQTLPARLLLANVSQFESGSVTVEYAGQQLETHFLYRNPWTWIKNMVSDSELWKTHMLHSVRKFYCRRDSDEDDRLIDETNTGDRWWEIEVRRLFIAFTADTHRTDLDWQGPLCLPNAPLARPGQSQQ